MPLIVPLGEIFTPGGKRAAQKRSRYTGMYRPPLSSSPCMGFPLCHWPTCLSERMARYPK